MAILALAELDPTGGGGQATDKRQDGTLIILGMLCDRLIMLCVNLITQRPARVSGPPSVCASTGAVTLTETRLAVTQVVLRTK